MIDEALFEAEEKMEKAVTVAKDDLGSVRTGRANPRYVLAHRDRLLRFDHADHAAREHQRPPRGPHGHRQAVRGSQLNAIETAIRNSDLGVNPSNDAASSAFRFRSSRKSVDVNW